MENKQPLLSICIPTYNRAEYLEGALINITEDLAFNDDVEIVISDNASTDNTYEIGNLFSRQYHNVFYFKNDNNILDGNFIAAQNRAKGKYIRLFNDTSRFKSGALKQMIDIIKTIDCDTNLFFFQNIPFLHNFECCKYKNKEEFLLNVSYYCTWISNWGCWNEEFKSINNLSRYSNLQLQQVDWFFQVSSKNKGGVIYFDDYFETIILPKKGGYNLLKVFIVNYMFLIRNHIKTLKVVNIEKRRLFVYFLKNWILGIFLYKNNYSFKTENAFKYIWNEYKLCSYFYFFIFLIPFYYIYYKCKKNIFFKK